MDNCVLFRERRDVIHTDIIHSEYTDTFCFPFSLTKCVKLLLQNSSFVWIYVRLQTHFKPPNCGLKIEVSWSAAGVTGRRRGFPLPTNGAGLTLAAGTLWFRMARLKWSLEGPGGNIRYFKNDWSHKFSQHLRWREAFLTTLPHRNK